MIPVCVFAKPLIPGQVKTRLVPVLGPERATGLAAAMFRDVWKAVSSCPGVRPVLATLEPKIECSACTTADFPVHVPREDIWLQGDGDLGARLENVLQRALRATPVAIAVGADSPLLTSAHLQEALDALATADAVIGPCPDGGFYLVALRSCPHGLFSGLTWSTPTTAYQTKRRLEARGFSVREVGSLSDVDTPDDLAELAAILRAQPSLAPATHAWLENGY